MRIQVLAMAAGLLEGCASGLPDPSECATNEVWTGGDEESALMHPGGDCIGCHDEEGEGPRYAVAGTVMGAYDDPTDCYGIEGTTIRLTDADGQIHETTSNRAGNFFFDDDIPIPYAAEVELDGAIRTMVAEQTDGNCASCHTEVGDNAAPGRIMAPG
jgi:hypothetical protein